MIEHINSHKLIGDMKIKRIIDRHTFRPEKYTRLDVYYDRHYNELVINFTSKCYRVKVEEKYKQDMSNLLKNYKIKNQLVLT